MTLKIHTDEGIYGLGDCTLNGRELSVASYLTDHVVLCIIGRDPFQTEDIWQYFSRTDICIRATGPGMAWISMKSSQPSFHMNVHFCQ